MDKVYTYDTIEETPFPNEVVVPVTASEPSAGGNYSPATTKPQSFPTRKIAYELLSSALNTRSRKVLQNFELQQSGGFQIGNYQEGISGDLRLTPNGLTGRDIAGLTTFAIDALTGDAIFKGTLEAGTLIGGDGQVVIDSDGGGRIIVNDGVTDRILIGYQQNGF